ncbi:hypothetical protein COUCH_25115 [Couchioplanes caeruleus]|uniref:hypothetical protein n=1 Tax=Couchioplanes caeruleus TaxID=56438 RepID=UPI0020BEFDA4|nr:hypothetical protein [Couchioplanes caeruleus]UQU62305.1 hypothetical protein COUCH_25115 [Couchioplanes caeruleus]
MCSRPRSGRRLSTRNGASVFKAVFGSRLARRRSGVVAACGAVAMLAGVVPAAPAQAAESTPVAWQTPGTDIRGVVSTPTLSGFVSKLGGVAIIGDTAYMADDGYIVRVNKRGGAVTWIAGSTEKGCADADTGAAARFNGETGLWSGRPVSVPVVIGTDGRLLYVRDDRCGLRTVDPTTGATRTIRDLPGSGESGGLPRSISVAGQTLYTAQSNSPTDSTVYERDLATGSDKVLASVPEFLDVILADGKYVWAWAMQHMYRIDRNTRELVEMPYAFNWSAQDITDRGNGPYWDGQVVSVGDYFYFVAPGFYDWNKIGRIHKFTGERSEFVSGIGIPEGDTDFWNYPDGTFKYLTGLGFDGHDLYITEYGSQYSAIPESHLHVVSQGRKLPQPPPPPPTSDPSGQPPAPQNRPQLDALEVTQSVQDLDNSVPLVAAKPTVVRAYLSTPGDPVRTLGRLRGFAGGRELPGSPLTAVNDAPGVLVDDDLANDRASLDRTLNFNLPASWTAQGQTELALELPGGFSCPGAESSLTMPCSKMLTFGASPFAADVEFSAVSWPEGGTRVEPSYTDLLEQSERTWSQLPTTGWHATFAKLEMDKRPTIDEVNEALVVNRYISRHFGDKRWYGVLHGSAGVRQIGGKATAAVASGWDDYATSSTAGGYGRNRAVHELGHTYGLNHSVNAAENGYKDFLGLWHTAKLGWCGEEADDDAPDYPDGVYIGTHTMAALGPIGDRRREIWGMDPRFLGTNEAAAVSSPWTTASLMSYCQEGLTSTQMRWIGQRDYRQLLSGDRDPISGWDTASRPVGTGLTLRGIIAADGASAQFKPALAVDLAPTPSDPDGTHELVLQDGVGAVLHSVRFTPERQDADAGLDGAGVGPQASLFNVVVPANLTGVARVQLRTADDGRTLAITTTTTVAPKVSVDTPATGSSTERLTISRSSRDADSPSLANTVLYSADGGTSWQVIGVDITGSSMSVPRWSLPGGTHAQLKVIASDGIRSTAAASKTFSLPDLAPMVTVSAPGTGNVFTGEQAISFAAQANDVEDGHLDGTAVHWSSDRDGPLGTGAHLPWRADQLSEGQHVITVTAHDSAGHTSTATVRITAQRVASPPKTVNLTPTVDVLTPGAGQSFAGTQSIPFTAQANDAEDGHLDGTAVQWSSDRDGPLGTGAQLPWSADQFSLGEHLITVTARDSAGQTSTATVRIRVVSAYAFGGFEAPVATAGPTTVKAGSTIPLKWSIFGPGVNAGTVASARFLSDGASYKMVKSGPSWHVNVQTPKMWATTTQLFRITLVDGSTYDAKFTLT